MQAPGMEAGAAYGEQSHNLAAQNPAQGGIPLPDRSAPPEVSPPPPLPVEQATSFIPNVTPLTAPGRGEPLRAPVEPPSTKQLASESLHRWADATNDPHIREAAVLLRSPE